MLKESTYQTPCGTIHYWSNNLSLDTTTLVFLPGLTADHRLFDKQVEYFDGKYNIIVWDAPAHASSWPFRFDFDLFDKAKWLNGILEKEEIIKPIIIGQSMGGYVGQAYAQLYPDRLAGFISIDSAPLQRNYVTAVEMSLADYNRKIAYVAQDNYLFNETVRENIRQGNPEATDEQIIEVTKKSGCYEFIMQLENGFDTVVGGAGGHLSGGERQRISIARAMLKDAPIVILDEATAYTDPENEAILQNSIAKLVAGKTLIVIAHRLSTVKDSDQIFVVNDGNVTAHGTHEELLVSCPLYKEMWNAHISVKDTVKEGE